MSAHRPYDWRSVEEEERDLEYLRGYLEAFFNGQVTMLSPNALDGYQDGRIELADETYCADLGESCHELVQIINLSERGVRSAKAVYVACFGFPGSNTYAFDPFLRLADDPNVTEYFVWNYDGQAWQNYKVGQ